MDHVAMAEATRTDGYDQLLYLFVEKMMKADVDADIFQKLPRRTLCCDCSHS